MRGYTKDELEAKSAKLASYIWCNGCRLYWHNRAFKKHLSAGAGGRSSNGRPKERPVSIVHPAWASFIDYLVETSIKQLMEERADKICSGEPVEARSQPVAERDVERADDEPEVLTVDEAVARLGVSREEILAAFDKNMVRFEVALR